MVMLMLMTGRLAIVMLDSVVLLVQVAYLALGQYRGPGRHPLGTPPPTSSSILLGRNHCILTFERSEIRYKV